MFKIKLNYANNSRNMLVCKLMSNGEIVFIPKMSLVSTDTSAGFKLKRFQFPLRWLNFFFH